MLVMWRKPPFSDRERTDQGPEDLGSQLEDLVMHVLRCERWARLDDRLDLAMIVQRSRTIRRRRTGGGE